MKLHREGTAILIGCLILFAIATGVLHYFFLYMAFILPYLYGYFTDLSFGFSETQFENQIRQKTALLHLLMEKLLY